VTIPLTITLNSGWHAPVTLVLDPSTYPPYSQIGLQMGSVETGHALSLPDALSPYLTLDQSGQAVLVAQVDAQTPPGMYVLPLSAASRDEQSNLELLLSVGELHSANFTYLPIIFNGIKSEPKPSTIYLPVVVKK
jgi:hypothetical protein